MTHERRLDAAVAVGLFALGLAMQLTVVTRDAFYMDEGFVLQTAAEINRGQVMYRDMVIPAPGPAAFHLLAGLFRLTGDSFPASRMAIAVVSSLLPAVLFLLVRGAVARPVAALAGAGFLAYRLWAFPHWHFFHYATCAAFLIALAYALLARALERRSLGLAPFAGAVAGVAFLTKQDVGGAALVGLAAATLLLGGPRRLAALVSLGAGALAAVLPILGYFAARGALGPLVEQTVLWTLRAFAQIDYLRLPNFRPFLSQDPALRSHIAEYAPALLVTLYWGQITASALFRETAVWDVALKVAYYLPYLTLGLGAVSVAGSWLRAPETPAAARRRNRATLIVIYAASSLAAFSPPRDWIHLLVLCHPILLVGALLLDRAAARLGPGGRRILLGLATAGLLAVIVVDVRILRDMRRTFDTPVDTPAGRVWLGREEAGVLRGLLAYVAERSALGEPLPVIPYHPLLQFFAARPAGTSRLIFWPVRSGDDAEARLIGDFERSRPATVVYSVTQYPHLRFRDNFPKLFAYLVEHYQIAHTFTPPSPWGLILCALTPRAPAPPAVVDLAERLDDAAVEAEDGHALEAAGRAAVAGRTSWPFRRVVYQRPGVEGPTTIAYRLSVPPHALIRFGYGLNPDEWFSFRPAAVTFAVTVAADGDAPRPLFGATVDPQRHPAERAWQEAEIDLAGLAGQAVVLRFQVSGDGPAGARTDLAGWGDPALVEGPSGG